MKTQFNVFIIWTTIFSVTFFNVSARIASNTSNARCVRFLQMSHGLFVVCMSLHVSMCVVHDREPCKIAEPIAMPFCRYRLA